MEDPIAIGVGLITAALTTVTIPMAPTHHTTHIGVSVTTATTVPMAAAKQFSGGVSYMQANV